MKVIEKKAIVKSSILATFKEVGSKFAYIDIDKMTQYQSKIEGNIEKYGVWSTGGSLNISTNGFMGDFKPTLTAFYLEYNPSSEHLTLNIEVSGYDVSDCFIIHGGLIKTTSPVILGSQNSQSNKIIGIIQSTYSKEQSVGLISNMLNFITNYGLRVILVKSIDLCELTKLTTIPVTIDTSEISQGDAFGKSVGVANVTSSSMGSSFGSFNGSTSLFSGEIMIIDHNYQRQSGVELASYRLMFNTSKLPDVNQMKKYPLIQIRINNNSQESVRIHKYSQGAYQTLYSKNFKNIYNNYIKKNVNLDIYGYVIPENILSLCK